MHVGAIDIGSNSIRLLVAELTDPMGELRPILRLGVPCRLGKGLEATGRVDDATLAAACLVLGDMAQQARGHGVTSMVVAATHALRVATNQAEALRRLGQACGQQVEILSGEEEANIVYRAVAVSLGPLARQAPLAIFDVGGGSTEIAVGAGREVGRFVSLPIGAVTLTERFLGADPPTAEQIRAVDAEIKNELMNNCALMPDNPAVMAGVGGTMTVLACIRLGLRSYDPSRINGAAIPNEFLDETANSMARMTRSDRIALPIMGEGRADIIVAGLRITLGLATYFRPRLMVASSQGLRFGLVREAAQRAVASIKSGSMDGPTGAPATGV